MQYLVIENTWLDRSFSSFGWGNGYVVIPKGHIFHGLSYDDLNEIIDCHGGITFSSSFSGLSDEIVLKINEFEGWEDSWVIGFDTCHYGDNLSLWPKAAVEDEAKNLRDRIIHLDTVLSKTVRAI